ncbi:protein lifeguard 3-like [Cylas formicarius]|uniref:protein lifeguard 3-like n=1 Tax=Cylas formicarius TaxID=197179 RepID=UPI0029587AF2|nr:protein lifeguard 3-like [Cylas formicarius]XP_060531290.1 protein lifeguard 3-like [Cylas formicarius]XP_060531291.1 protein lifeguard 3-like [Cylas formicarius]
MSEHTNTSSNHPQPNDSRNNVMALASKHDVIAFQEPTTSKNYAFKTEIRINILSEHPSEDKKLNSSSSQILLPIFKDVEPDESFTTVDACVKEKTTNTREAVFFNRGERIQRLNLANSEAPPPYDSRPPPAYSPVYRPQTVPSGQYIMDANQGSGYQPTPLEYYYMNQFVNQKIRNNFIKKVYAILALQLAISTAFTFLVTHHRPTKNFVRTNIPMFWIMVALQMILFIALTCYQNIRKTFPTNFVVLFLFTIAMTYLCGTITAYFSTKIVMTSLASTGLICVLVTLLAFQTQFDITKWSFILALAALVLTIFGIVTIIVIIITHSTIIWLVYSALVTVMFTIFLLYDTQCIMGGRRVEISPEEYIFGALTLYTDIILIFMYSLHLLNACIR